MLKKIILIISGLFTLFAMTLTFASTSNSKKVENNSIKIAQKGSYRYTYTVFGKRYFVLTDSKNYIKTGTASWYGGKFHGRHTSSGEHYNMYAMTAAHKTLPLSTYVLVTNLKNGKKVVVKINDRGPFVSDRLIDLSYGAAKRLGMVEQGLATVSIKAMSSLA